MTEALFAINNDGQLISATYYTITPETLERKLLTEELINEVISRVIEQDCKNWSFIFEDLRVEILKKLKYKIEFFVSRDISAGDVGLQRLLSIKHSFDQGWQ